MKRYKRNLAVLLAAVTAVLSAGCEIEEVPRAAEEDERQVLEEASSLAFTGDLDDITLTSDLTADGVIAGSIKIIILIIYKSCQFYCVANFINILSCCKFY